MLAVDALHRTYASGAGTLTVLRDVSFDLGRGESLAIVGPSGSGKTTLLGLCAGLDQPTSGEVTLDGTALSGLDQDALAVLRRDRVGFVFQSFRLLSTLTALENVMVPAELAGRRDARKAATELLAATGLGDRLDHHPGQLSGGEQQRVALARAFVNRPALLFADEPTGNLDGASAERVADLLFDLQSREGTTLVLVTHNDELAERTGRILRLKDGAVVSDESIAPSAPAVAAVHPAPR